MKNIISGISITVLISLASISFVACNSNALPVNAGQNTPSNVASVENNQNTNSSSSASNIVSPFKNSNKKTVKAKGLYLTATSVGARLKHYIDLANTTEINSYIIDYKDDDGYVCVDSKVPLAKQVKAIDVRYDAEKVVKELHANNIYAIARIVCFKDPFLSQNMPDTAIKNKDGKLYIHNQKTWVNAYNKDAWQYNIDLAKEALQKGFDEVQFDYVRFPDGKKTDMAFGNTGDKNMYETIDEFLAAARQQMPDATLSADIFAITVESPGDTEGIGQYFEYVGKDMDYICPMSYPSHYAIGQIINNVMFPKPDLDPYGVVKNTYLKAKARLSKVEGHKPLLRAYLQDFTATWIGKGNYQHYGDEQVRQEIKAVYDAGYEEWFLWDPMNTYEEGALEKKK